MCSRRAVQRDDVPPGGMLVYVYLACSNTPLNAADAAAMAFSYLAVLRVAASVVDDAKQGGGDISDAVKSRLLV